MHYSHQLTVRRYSKALSFTAVLLKTSHETSYLAERIATICRPRLYQRLSPRFYS